jgi:hypothetical protein
VKTFFYRIKGQECTAHDARIATSAFSPMTRAKEKKKRRRKKKAGQRKL